MDASTCASCSAPVHAAVEKAPFCAWCGKPRSGVVVVPAGGIDDPELAAKIRRAKERAAQAPRERVFTTSASRLCLAYDPQIGFALIGVHAPEGEEPRLRAYDMYNKRVAWEALAGAGGLKALEHLAVRGRNVYVSLGRSLQVLDLFTGQVKWGAEFSDALKGSGVRGPLRGLQVHDPMPQGQPGAVIVVGVDSTLHSLDRDTGRLLWRETRERMPSKISTLGETGLVLLEGSPLQLVSPTVQKPVLETGAPSHMWLSGAFGLWQVKHWGWRDREGVVLFDFAHNQEVFFEALEDVEYDVPMVMGHGRVFCAVDDEKLCAAPGGKTALLKEGFEINALCMVGPTLFALVTKKQGTRYRRVLGVDPQTLAVRFDLGEFSTQPTKNLTEQMVGNGHLAVVVTAKQEHDHDGELWGVLPTGQVLWKTPVSRWQAHYFTGGHVVVDTEYGWMILRPDDGSVVAEYKRDG